MSSSPPSTAAIEPIPAGTAACIRRPRSATSDAASRSGSAPAHTSAEYSPRLWPAICAGSGPPFARQAFHTATLAASNTGWVFSVLPSSASGPFCASDHRSRPAPSEASSKTLRTSGNSAPSSASIPTDCEPWPGKTKASWGTGGWGLGTEFVSLIVCYLLSPELAREDGSSTALCRAVPQPQPRSIPHHRGGPGEPATESLQQQVLSALHAPGAHRGIQRQRHRPRRGVGVLVDRDDHLLHRHAEPLGGG